jgi:hypothetical protein
MLDDWSKVPVIVWVVVATFSGIVVDNDPYAFVQVIVTLPDVAFNDEPVNKPELEKLRFAAVKTDAPLVTDHVTGVVPIQENCWL